MLDQFDECRDQVAKQTSEYVWSCNIFLYMYMYKWFLICRYGNIIISSKHSQFICCMNMSILPWLMSYMIQDSLSVECIYRIYCAGWNGMYWLNSRNWIRASLELAFGGRWWHVSTWQWMALATSFQDRGGKVGKLTKQFWWNLGVQPETKTLSESIVSVERFDYSGYQCRFNRRHAQYNKHILLTYLYCVFSRSCCQ